MGGEEIRIPPQNIEAEKSVLGAMLIDEEAIGLAIEILDVSWFYEDSHQKIYSAIVALYQNRKNVDLVTLSDKLKSDGTLDPIGGQTYLSMLIDMVPTAANVEHYANIVKEKGILRRLIKNATQIVQECHGNKGKVAEVVDTAERLIFEVAELKHKQNSFHVKELVKTAIEKAKALIEEQSVDLAEQALNHATEGDQHIQQM